MKGLTLASLAMIVAFTTTAFPQEIALAITAHT
jgi:hypothetical protein